MTSLSRRLLLLLGTVVLASGYTDFRIRTYPDYAYTTYIPKVVDGTYGAPAIYRVLVPFTNTWIVQATGWPAANVWHLTRLLWFIAAYLALYAYLRTWFDPQAAFGGLLAVAATLPLTYTNSWAHPDGTAELALFTLGCLAIVQGRDLLFLTALVLAALNRETAAFMVVAYACVHWPDRRALLAAAGFGVVFAAIYAGLRAWRGLEHYDYWQLGRNVAFLRPLPPAFDLYKRFFGWFALGLLAPALAVLAAGWRAVPQTPRRLVLAAVPFVLTAVTFSSVIETRIFLPVFPLALPALMFALDLPKRVTEGTPSVA